MSQGFRLNEKEKNEIREAFKLFDIKGEGRISAKDTVVALRALGTEPDKEEVRSMFTAINKDAGESLNFEEFSKIMSMKMNQSMSGAEISRAFVMLRDDETERIDIERLREMCKEIGEELESDELLHLMRAAGATSDKDTIDLQAFTSMLSSTQQQAKPG
mmetsp:Transcript_19021/g.26534  ORF Transcript_19021/g.26534 Transcript_19021/m.26534 type:complete len:160 (+) Transcript_19021:42-521(+)